MTFNAKRELLQQLKDIGYMVTDPKSDVEASTEFLDNTLEKFKSTLANKEDFMGVDYLLGSIDAKIDSLENEILECQNTISFLRFLKDLGILVVATTKYKIGDDAESTPVEIVVRGRRSKFYIPKIFSLERQV